jgi:hypothetical protein
MKRLIVAAAVGLVAVGAFAQGQISVGNRITGKVDAPVTTAAGVKLDGAAYLAQAYVGKTADSLAPVGTALAFRTGAAAGYITTTATTVPGAPDGTALFFQLRAWEAAGGTSYESAFAAGKLAGMSNIVPITSAEAPNLPNAPVGLTGFALAAIPEPSTLALGMLGAAALLLRRRS